MKYTVPIVVQQRKIQMKLLQQCFAHRNGTTQCTPLHCVATVRIDAMCNVRVQCVQPTANGQLPKHHCVVKRRSTVGGPRIGMHVAVVHQPLADVQMTVSSRPMQRCPFRSMFGLRTGWVHPTGLYQVLASFKMAVSTRPHQCGRTVSVLVLVGVELFVLVQLCQQNHVAVACCFHTRRQRSVFELIAGCT